MELVKKTFLQRLQYMQVELRAIAQSPEIREMINAGYYDPDITLIDAMRAVAEVIEDWGNMQNHKDVMSFRLEEHVDLE